MPRAASAYDSGVSRPETPTRPRPKPRRREGGHRFEECEHLVRDDDPDTSLCGIDQTDVPWNQGFPICQACLAVAQGRMS
jgi:hypothetical protein